jgi:hypothetical protein
MNGIAFNAEMVRALPNGKTQTRRVIKGACDIVQCWDPLDKSYGPYFEDEYGDSHLSTTLCPFGKVGDRLFVQEDFEETWDGDSAMIATYKADGVSRFPSYTGGECKFKKMDYRNITEWTPAKEMPEWASRFTIEITDIRAERVQDISNADAVAEGMPLDDAVYDFSCLWNSIYGPGAWDENQYVWVLTFKLVEGGEE